MDIEISPIKYAAIPRRRHGAIQCQMGARHGRTCHYGPKPTTASYQGSRHAARASPRGSCGACIVIADGRYAHTSASRLSPKAHHRSATMSSRRPRPRCTHALAYCCSASSSSGSEAATRHAASNATRPGGLTLPYFGTGWTARKFTVDDLRESIGEPQGSGTTGSTSASGCADKIIHHGYRPSRIKSNHGHMVRFGGRHERHDTHQPQARLCPLLRGMGRR